MHTFSRADGRVKGALRPFSVEYGWSSHAAGSVLFTMGKTKILASAIIQAGVPVFRRGKQAGWLTAEYNLMPAAASPRVPRDAVLMRRDGRSIEIGRMIGRALRAVCNLAVLGERTIFIDCDVLNADGGTRAASIMAASLALREAEAIWLREGILSSLCMRDELIAVSLGLSNNTVLIDLTYEEDRLIDADCIAVFTRNGSVVEVGISAERSLVTQDHFLQIVGASFSVIPSIVQWYAETVDIRYQALPALRKSIRDGSFTCI